VSTACATGSHAIGDAASYIQRGMADVMIAGAAEACIEYAMGECDWELVLLFLLCVDGIFLFWFILFR
jgi:acetyl-CoA acetyltransferase